VEAFVNADGSAKSTNPFTRPARGGGIEPVLPETMLADSREMPAFDPVPIPGLLSTCTPPKYSWRSCTGHFDHLYSTTILWELMSDPVPIPSLLFRLNYSRISWYKNTLAQHSYNLQVISCESLATRKPYPGMIFTTSSQGKGGHV